MKTDRTGRWNLTVAMTGASGAVFGQMLLQRLDADERVERVHFIPSENSLRVLAEELGLSGRNDLAEKLLGTAPVKTVQLSDAAAQARDEAAKKKQQKLKAATHEPT